MQLRRGVAGYRGRSPNTQGTLSYQEKGEAFCPSTKTGQDYECPFEGGNRFIPGLSFHHQMTLVFFEVPYLTFSSNQHIAYYSILFVEHESQVTLFLGWRSAVSRNLDLPTSFRSEGHLP